MTLSPITIPGHSSQADSAPTAPAQRPDPAGVAPGLMLVLVGVVVSSAIATMLPVSSLVIAVVIGAVIGNIGLTNPVTEPGLSFAAKRILRVAVVLLGLRLSFTDIADLGPTGIAVVAITVTVTFFGTQVIGRRMGLSRDLSLLVATGYSICGASAIAAVEGSTDADEEEVAAAIGLVTLFGSLAIVALPALAGPLGLSNAQFGAWAGASVHDVAQVAATASVGGASVVAVAMVVKLTRVLLLTPIVVGVNVKRSRSAVAGHQTASDTNPSVPPILPLFVAGFLAMIALRTTGRLPADAIERARTVDGVLFTAALVGLGAGVRFDRLRRLGPKPLLLGAMAWVLVAVASYLGIIVLL